MRKTKRPTVVAAVETAWAAVFAECEIEDATALEKAGWKSSYEIAAETGRDAQFVKRRLNLLVDAKKFERKEAKVLRKGRVQSIVFYRPKG